MMSPWCVALNNLFILLFVTAIRRVGLNNRVACTGTQIIIISLCSMLWIVVQVKDQFWVAKKPLCAFAVRTLILSHCVSIRVLLFTCQRVEHDSLDYRHTHTHSKQNKSDCKTQSHEQCIKYCRALRFPLKIFAPIISLWQIYFHFASICVRCRQSFAHFFVRHVGRCRILGGHSAIPRKIIRGRPNLIFLFYELWKMCIRVAPALNLFHK